MSGVEVLARVADELAHLIAADAVHGERDEVLVQAYALARRRREELPSASMSLPSGYRVDHRPSKLEVVDPVTREPLQHPWVLARRDDAGVWQGLSRHATRQAAEARARLDVTRQPH